MGFITRITEWSGAAERAEGPAELPGRVEIGVQSYAVEFATELLERSQRAGEIDYNAGVIRLHGELCEDRLRETIMHEVLHGAFDFVKLDEILESVQDTLNELVVSMLAPVLLQTLRRNPELVAYLLAEAA